MKTREPVNVSGNFEPDGRCVRIKRDPPGQRSVYIPPGNPERETYRLSTFKDFPRHVPVDPRQFAFHGFYYTGYKDRVKCFNCGQASEEWTIHDDPRSRTWHDSNCDLINGRQTNNIPILSFSDPFRRNATPSHSPTSVSSRSLTHHAQSRVAPSAAGTCAGEVLLSTIVSPSTTTRLSDLTPRQQHVQTSNEQNFNSPSPVSERAGETSSPDPSLIFPCLHPVNPHMRSTEARLQTFRDNANIWPAHRIRATPQEIADAGFFYLGERDRTKCWYCNGGLQNWERDDNPWEEHAKWFPMCEFILGKKGPEFVHGIVSRFPNLRRPTLYNPSTGPAVNRIARIAQARDRGPAVIDPQHELQERSRRIEEEMTSSAVVAEARLMGFEEEIIKEALKRKLESGGQVFINLESLVDALLGIPREELAASPVESSPSPETLIKGHHSATSSNFKEMQRLETERLCKVCRKDVACVVLIPCGHLACCVECSKLVKKCPLCKIFIKEKVRSYLS